MSKKLVTALVLVWGTALAANCGGGSDEPANGNGGSGGNGNGGDSSGGTKAGTAGSAGKGGSSSGGTSNGGTAGKGGTAGNAGNTSQAGQSMGGEATGGSPGAGGMSAAGDTGAGGTPAAGSDAGGAGGAGGAGPVGNCPATIDLYPGVVAKAICDKRVDCCMSDANQCMMDVGDALDQIFTDLVQSEKDGLTAANCDALAKCVAAINAADCKVWPAELGDSYGIPVTEPACRHFIEPKVQATDACTANYQCIDGYCIGNNPVCTAFAADGDSCAASICNVATSYCDANSKCAPQLANGKDCSADGDCQSRICDGSTNKCVAPDPKNDCEFTPSGCSLVSASPRGGLGWSLLAGFITLGVVARRRRARR